ncbi:hypothetical protein FLAPXU55_01604 [Flavobacterium panici]|uniref:Uncharacterized protein n=1 Tax=Flavobacterium panici TaxID=2654843 RepID=A0A9N8J0L0_9FLAO|nr:hypothetical protein FLAPXU55_01604 [Flavobacterium panici]
MNSFFLVCSVQIFSVQSWYGCNVTLSEVEELLSFGASTSLSLTKFIVILKTDH